MKKLMAVGVMMMRSSLDPFAANKQPHIIITPTAINFFIASRLAPLPHR